MSARIFVDETKAKGYVVAAASGQPEELKIAQKQLQSLILSGQRSLHMKSEGDSRRRAIADTIGGLPDFGISATIYDAGRLGTERDRRARCLDALVTDAAQLDAVSIVFDLDRSLASWDRQRMIELTRAADAQDRITYRHSSRHEEQMLAIPDVVAWCWARGGDWRRRVEPVVIAVRKV